MDYHHFQCFQTKCFHVSIFDVTFCVTQKLDVCSSTGLNPSSHFTLVYMIKEVVRRSEVLYFLRAPFLNGKWWEPVHLNTLK